MVVSEFKVTDSKQDDDEDMSLIERDHLDLNDHVNTETASENENAPYDVEHPDMKAALENGNPFDFGGPAYSQNVDNDKEASGTESLTLTRRHHRSFQCLWMT